MRGLYDTKIQTNMETSQIPQIAGSPADGQKLKIDFSWRKFTCLVSDAETDAPLFKTKYHAGKPQLEFRTAGQDEITIGTGTLNYVSINAACVLRERHIEIKALAHLKSKYTYLSRAFASDADSRVGMTWTGDWGLKTLDLVCLNDRQEAVAKLSCNLWAMRKIATLEFAGGMVESQAAKEELVVTGLTTMYCLVGRSGNILSLLGAAFARPGQIKQNEQSASDHVQDASQEGVKTKATC